MPGMVRLQAGLHRPARRQTASWPVPVAYLKYAQRSHKALRLKHAAVRPRSVAQAGPLPHSPVATRRALHGWPRHKPKPAPAHRPQSVSGPVCRSRLVVPQKQQGREPPFPEKSRPCSTSKRPGLRRRKPLPLPQQSHQRSFQCLRPDGSGQNQPV